MENISTSRNIEIQVATTFESEFSKPELPSFIFSYKITIKNNNNFPVQILNREWIITDSNGEVLVVRGVGVVGLTPIIEANGSFEYTSNVNLKSAIGKMQGNYGVKNINNSTEFIAPIPEFKLEAEFILN